MTHGTDRDTPTGEAADRDPGAGPERPRAEGAREGVPQPHDAPEAAPSRPSDAVDAPEPGADDVPQDVAPAEPTAPGEPTASVEANAADEPAAGEPATDEPTAGEPTTGEPTTGEPTADQPTAADEAAAAVPVPGAADVEQGARTQAPVDARRRPLAPDTEPLAAWPSWDDVAVTAPAAPASDATGTDAPHPSSDGTDAPHPSSDGTDAPSTSAADPDGSAPGAAEDDRSDAPPRGDEPAPLPPLSIGGLSALAFTALNAASVGVPAHALPQSPVSGSPAETDDRGDAASAGVPAADEVPDAPAADEPTPARAADEPHASGTSTATDAPATDAPATDAPAADAPTAVLPPAPSAAARDDLATRAAPAAASPAARPTTADGGGDLPGAPGGPVEATPDAERGTSPLDVFEPDAGHRRWPRVLAVVGGSVALVGALYVGASYGLADRVPRGATVAGVEIGSMSSDEAEQHLADGLADRTTSPVPVVAQEVQAEVDPAAAGLELDPSATVARLTGVDLTEPVRLWRHLVGVGEEPPVSRVDEDALEAALTQLSGSLTLAPVDGTVVFADGAAHATEAVDGWELDTDGAATVLADGWLTQERPLALPTSVVAPAVSQEETDRALRELAQPLAAAPVTVQVADRQAVLDVPTLTANASVVPVDGVLDLQLDGAALADAVLTQVPDLLTTASDARFEFQDGSPVIVPGTAGTTLDPAALATSVVTAATAGTDRLAAVELVQSDPAQTTAELEGLGVKEVVSEFSTPLTNEPRRTGNIANGLKNITGTLVRPGETFSLTEALGPVDAAHGFVQAGAIVNGEHKDAWGGGLSQVSTTTYNAAYFAGFEDVEHTPHSEWFQRYPEGREATIFTGVLDLKWKNNTPYGALVQGYVADGRAHVRIWSTKHFTVETSKSGRSGVVNPTTVYSQSPTCEPQSAGNPGFTVTNTRRVLLNGEVVDTESLTWRYKPQNRVICGTAPAPGAAPTP
ncbi:VanW family protein [Cellulomonas sp. Sa3CUA2]|uniref:VanW family protein n=1 Tax=Cellulomonas avistercoris TaxID=2762242 RepID=A0ABR8QFH2_9CELL|nr:VanW family protein [Cellulomonas avistercoris]MBD7919166.1 VanW family protein [Cellulomonas avistercoris]